MKFETGQTTTTQHGNNSQQHTTWCANARNILGPTMLRLVGQQCCERLHGPLRSPRALLVELNSFNFDWKRCNTPKGFRAIFVYCICSKNDSFLSLFSKAAFLSFTFFI